KERIFLFNLFTPLSSSSPAAFFSSSMQALINIATVGIRLLDRVTKSPGRDFGLISTAADAPESFDPGDALDLSEPAASARGVRKPGTDRPPGRKRFRFGSCGAEAVSRAS